MGQDFALAGCELGERLVRVPLSAAEYVDEHGLPEALSILSGGLFTELLENDPVQS